MARGNGTGMKTTLAAARRINRHDCGRDPNAMRCLYMALVFIAIAPSVCLSQTYQWVDANGVVQYSDRKPADVPATEVTIETLNVFDAPDGTSHNAHAASPTDTFVLPFARSDVPYRYVMTSAINVDEPVDNLSSINISLKQKSFHSFVSLTGVHSGALYNMRMRVIDAKGVLIFDQGKSLGTPTNSLWFVVRISPKVHIDASGTWTIQGILNNETLFVERRGIFF